MPDATDTLFVNERFEDHKRLAGVRFSQCTFANVSFKDAELFECHFSGCVFEGCYFRRTEFRDTHFPASRFIDCEFIKPVIIDSSFGHTRFFGTVIPYNALESSLPGQANVCRDLTVDLAVQAAAQGRDREARAYRLVSIGKHEEALWRGVRWTDPYAQAHYPSDLQRLTALLRFLASKSNGLLWGYGESLSGGY